MACSSACLNSYRRLTIAVSVMVTIINILTSFYFYHLGNDPFDISKHMIVYGVFASLLGSLGYVGARSNNSTFVTIFANFLLLDVIISIIPRVLAFTLMPSIEGAFCSADSLHAWLEAQPFWEMADKEEVFRDVAVQCHNVLEVVHYVVVFAAVAITFIQCWLALKIYRFSGLLRHHELLHVQASFPKRSSSRMYSGATSSQTDSYVQYSKSLMGEKFNFV